MVFTYTISLVITLKACIGITLKACIVITLKACILWQIKRNCFVLKQPIDRAIFTLNFICVCRT